MKLRSEENKYKLILSLCLLAASVFSFEANTQPAETLLNVPAGSKITFMKDFKILPSEKQVTIGKFSHGGVVTECVLYMKGYDNAVRMIPKNTTFKVFDTRTEFNKRADLLLDSQVLRSIGCTNIRSQSDSTQYLSENDLSETKVSEAKQALGSKVKLEISKDVKLVKN